MKRTAFSSHNELYVQYLKSENKHNMSVQHYHDTYEIYLQLSGKRYLFYDNTCYHVGAWRFKTYKSTQYAHKYYMPIEEITECTGFSLSIQCT